MSRPSFSRDPIDTAVHAWKFGSLEFRTRGAGLFFASDKLKARIMAMPFADAKTANAEAWLQKKRAEGEMDRLSNVSVHGTGPYDRASHAFYVASDICKITWRRMQVRQ